MISTARWFAGLGLAALVASIACDLRPRGQIPFSPTEGSGDAWKNDWSVQRGFSISMDTDGYAFPSALAFVPDPGSGPKDPLYFVTELRGTVKVVTNDRSVHTFAKDFFALDPVAPEGVYPGLELGMAGICLDQPRGYVFVTFIYTDAQKVLRNNIVRFQTTPGTFSLAPISQIDFAPVFAADRSNISHQIGPCQVSGDSLYVGVGDGEQPFLSQSLGSLLGKIVRMTVDGAPVPDNPFFTDQNQRRAANYVWASGLRNPFGLKLAEGSLFAADNGPTIDRFLEIHKGENYLWDGTDRSIGTNAIAVLAPGRGVTQVAYRPRGPSTLPPALLGTFFQVVSGDTENVAIDAPPQILAIEYDTGRKSLARVPRTFLRYRGTRLQTLTGADLGADGLYFVALFPNSSGATPVYRVATDAAQHPFIVDAEVNPRIVMSESGCLSCHALYANQTGGQGPVLDRDVLVPRLEARLNSEAYREAAAKVDGMTTEPFVSFRSARSEVARAQGREKLILWIEHHLLEPRFDNPNAQMPNLGLSRNQARAVAAYLLGEPYEEAEPEGTAQEDRAEMVRRLLLQPRPVVLLAGLVAGVFIGVISHQALQRRRRHGRPS